MTKKPLPPLVEYTTIKLRQGSYVTMPGATKEYGRLDRCKGRPHAGGIDLYEHQGEPLRGAMVLTVSWNAIMQAERKGEEL